MLLQLLRAHSFAEGYVQGVIKFIFIGLLFLAITAVYKAFSKKKENNDVDGSEQPNAETFESQSIIGYNINKGIDPQIAIPEIEPTTTKDSINLLKPHGIENKFKEGQIANLSYLKSIFNYFSPTYISKGYKRIIFVGSFFFSLLCGIISYYTSTEKRSDGYYSYTNYDDSAFVTGFIVGYFIFWIIYCIIIWIMKGFKEEQKV